MQQQINSPLVSVIIPCYNHGRYLQAAIDSVRQQEVAAEIVVVDDGSADETPAVAQRNADVVYVYQQNSGLSAARNTGMRHSKGQFLLFLDADDWLLPGALHNNLRLLQQHPDAAFVSGGHQKVFTASGEIETVQTSVTSDHYRNLLQGNYIGMHATVLYRKAILEQFLFDESLRACEDYDVYLRIARHHPVLHHTGLVAAYRIHGHNMSGNIPMMLRHVRLVLQRQQSALRSPEEHQALSQGLAVWNDYYATQLLRGVKNGSNRTFKNLVYLFKLKPSLAFKWYTFLNPTMIKEMIKKRLPKQGLKLAHKLGLYNNYQPPVGSVNMGDLDTVKPLSTNFGYDRGGPVDRYYIENFLQQESGLIRGRALEIGDNEYTLRFGGTGVTQSDILHVDASNEKATFIGDLSDAPQLPDNSFDAIVLTQTLHLIYDFKGALATCYRILKPGGTLLLTVPGITPIDQGEWNTTWYWSFTDKGMRALMQEMFPVADTTIECFGNVLSATAFLYGMGVQEVSREKLDYRDPFFQVIITVKATKKG